MSNGRIVELGVHMKPTGALRAAVLQSVDGLVDGLDVRSHVAGGEISMRVVGAPSKPGIPDGTYLGAIVETWPDGHFEILGAIHASSATAATVAILPHYEEIVRARKG